MREQSLSDRRFDRNVVKLAAGLELVVKCQH
jgi:hypothetical protein